MEIKSKLRDLVYESACQKYGIDRLPKVLSDPLNEELKLIESRGLSAAFYKAYMFAHNENIYPEENRRKIFFNGMLPSSFVAYVLGLSAYNPLRLNDEMALDVTLFYENYKNIDKKNFEFTAKVGSEAMEILKNSNPGVKYEYHKGLDLLSNLEEALGEKYAANVSVSLPFTFDDPLFGKGSIRSFFIDDLFSNNKKEIMEHKNDMKFIPAISDNLDKYIEFLSIYKDTDLFRIEDLIKVTGWVMAEGITKCKSMDEMPSCTEDLYSYLLKYLPDSPNYCRDIALRISSGHGLDKEDTEILCKAGAQTKTVLNIGSISKLYSRAEIISEILVIKSLLYFYYRYRDEYIAIYDEMYGERTAI